MITGKIRESRMESFPFPGGGCLDCSVCVALLIIWDESLQGDIKQCQKRYEFFCKKYKMINKKFHGIYETDKEIMGRSKKKLEEIYKRIKKELGEVN